MDDRTEGFTPNTFENKPPKKLSTGILVALIAGGVLILVLVGVIIFLAVGGDDGAEVSDDESAEISTDVSTDKFSFSAPDLVGKMWSDELAKEIKPIVIDPKNIAYDAESDAPGGQILSQTPAPGTPLYCDENGICGYVKITVSGKAFSDKYTSLVGKTAEEAMAWLLECGVKKEDVFRKYSASTTGVGNGCVSSLTYENGAAVEEGDKVKEGDRFILSINSYPSSVSVPFLGNKSFESAVELLYENKLNVGEITYKESGFADGTVLSQDPPADETAYYGDKVNLVLSKRAGAFKMPDLAGLTREEAEELLSSYGLELGTVTEVSDREYDHGTVCYQNVEAQTEVYAFTVIDIKLAVGGKADPKVDWDADTILIDVTENSFLSAGTLEKLMSDCRGKQVIVTGANFNWVLPKGAEYPEDDARLDMGVLINSGDLYADAVDILVEDGYETGDFAVIARTGEDDLPEGTILSVELGFAFSGFNVSLLSYDDETGAFVRSEQIYTVTENGGVSLPIEKGKLFAVVLEQGTSYSVKVEYDKEEAYCEEGSLVSVIGGDSITLHFGALEGYAIVSVRVNGVKLEGVNGVYTIPAVNGDYTMVIETAEFYEESEA